MIKMKFRGNFWPRYTRKHARLVLVLSIAEASKSSIEFFVERRRTHSLLGRGMEKSSSASQEGHDQFRKQLNKTRCVPRLASNLLVDLSTPGDQNPPPAVQVQSFAFLFAPQYTNPYNQTTDRNNLDNFYKTSPFRNFFKVKLQ